MYDENDDYTPDDYETAPRGRVPPHSTAAEESLLGAMLLSRQAVEVASNALVATDFYTPNYGTVFSAIIHLYNQGEPIDPVTVADELSRLQLLDSIGGPPALINLQSLTPSTSSAPRYAKTIAGHSVLRKLIAAAGAMMEEAYGIPEDPGDVVDAANARFAEAMTGVAAERPEDLWILDEFLDRPMEDRPPWVIAGLLRKGWRAMVVATEGVGKTVLFRQIGIAAAQGIHPLHFQKIDPIRVLIVDLENPEDSIHDVCQPLRSQTEMVSQDYDSERAYLWHKPGGIDVRSRRDRMELEAAIAETRPDLVCLGPIYKAYSITGKESDEMAAKEVMQVFDDLRTRYDFALLLEHHAPKGSGKTRELQPYGSSLWLRWPELGLKLTATEPEGKTLTVGRWRGDRLENSWPIKIHRGTPWLWQGEWPDGTFSEPGAPRVPTSEDFSSQPIYSSGAPEEYGWADDGYDDDPLY